MACIILIQQNGRVFYQDCDAHVAWKIDPSGYNNNNFKFISVGRLYVCGIGGRGGYALLKVSCDVNIGDWLRHSGNIFASSYPQEYRYWIF